MTVDDLDRRLVGLLKSDARRSTASLATELGVPRTTLHERIERLRRRGVILGFTALLATEPAHSGSRAVMLVAVDDRRSAEALGRIADLPEVRQCLAVDGEYTHFLRVEAPLDEDVEAVQDEILAIPGVAACRTFLVLSSKFEREAYA